MIADVTQSNGEIFVIDKVLNQWRARAANESRKPANRRLHLHFFAKPLEVVGDDSGLADQARTRRSH